MRHKITTLAITIAAAVFCSVSAIAATISFSDLTEGTPTLTTDLTGLTFTIGLEELRATVSLTNTALPLGTKAVLLNEQAAQGGGVSDYLTMLVAGAPGLQTLSFVFQSDGALGFNAAVAALQLLQTPTLLESGGLQDVSSILGTTGAGLTVNIQSDVTVGGDVPEPGTLLLLATGLLGTAVLRFRTR